MSARPIRITILHQTEADDPNPSRGRYVGRTQDGRQFFLTTPFVPALFGGPLAGHDFIAIYQWDADGEFIDASFEEVVVRDADSPLPGNTLPEESYEEGFRRALAKLGPVEFGDIEVAPFEVQFNGATFGLIPQPPENEEEDWTVIALPGDYMCFFSPWDGEYDT
jgi:hypothetical protein